MAKYASYDYEGYRFVFKYDDEFPDMLHIWVRHTKTVEDAIEIWFEAADETWDANHERYQTYSKSQGLYWFWLEENKVIMVVSCFDI
ncbi:MAG: hypothetical protein KC777_24170 [Cyanobacteria bacterium HKST-UBA02]|nr:hypothetical protein [Cyanobacteria bacterium HKST-UBA02]